METNNPLPKGRETKENTMELKEKKRYAVVIFVTLIIIAMGYAGLKMKKSAAPVEVVPVAAPAPAAEAAK